LFVPSQPDDGLLYLGWNMLQ